jgi:hypothetical protein
MSKNQQQKDWYKKTLEKIDNIMSSDKDIADKYLEIYKYTRTALDGEPTTADEHNTMQEDEKLVYEEDFGETRNAQHFSSSPENVVRISDVNKEIAKEWNRDREEKINKEEKVK